MSGALGEVARNGRLAWLIGYSAVVFMLLRATIYLYQPYLARARARPDRDRPVVRRRLRRRVVVAYRTHLLRRRFGDEVLLWALLGALAISFLGLAGAAQRPVDARRCCSCRRSRTASTRR